jgi:hypothetical protein
MRRYTKDRNYTSRSQKLSLLIGLCAILTTTIIVFVFSLKPQDIRGRASYKDGWSREEKLVDQYYRIFLGRTEPRTSLNFRAWVTYLKNSTCARTLKQFSTSPEFTRRIHSMTDNEFIAMMYQGVISRNPEPAGVQHHLDMLKNYTRTELFRKFTDNPESIAVCSSGKLYPITNTPTPSPTPPPGCRWEPIMCIQQVGVVCPPARLRCPSGTPTRAPTPTPSPTPPPGCWYEPIMCIQTVGAHCPPARLRCP